MKINATTVIEYIQQIPHDKQSDFIKLIEVILNNIPEGFEECIIYNMPSWVVPHSIYPQGYHCDPSKPLPFLSLGVQKNFIGFYHMGIYAKPELLKWFQDQWAVECKTKLDMGKSCVRLKKEIPFSLLEELLRRMSLSDVIEIFSKVSKS